ncbi:mechanosensitive ion channel family protein [Candidatus Entotheonella palauensis]|uniref:Cyclic nucleotide-binding domain-containing protein n=1 Tax=Candidatus Entotheonella gemina TaxID=1429439 RepID=W4M4Q2_9BACT|nr:mechanosensitive ion channel family protein [Candidatus Entotheonella palauensis]ETX05299.1 MAG: hypothetical protein ETSY2_23770 [Candidatus Entotheonella gemina]
METSLFVHPDLLIWGLALAIGLPILVLALGELHRSLEQRGNPLAKGVWQIRSVVLPVLALWLIVRNVLSLDDSQYWMRAIETLVWFSVAYAGLTLVRNLTQVGEVQPTVWVNKVPGLFFILTRAFMIVWVVSQVLSGVWEHDLSQVGTVVGFGGMALAIALQDTLSNLVSGFLLLIDRPFKVGDWCEINGRWMQVKQIGWRTTRCEERETQGSVIIPNGSLGRMEITNYGQHDTPYCLRVKIGFAYDDAPNLVMQVLRGVAQSMDEVMPPIEVLVFGYKDFAIEYRVSMMVDVRDQMSAWGKFHTLLYYAVKRNGLTLARPIEFRGNLYDLSPKIELQTIAELLRANPLFESLETEMIDWLVTGTTVHDYAADEVMIRQGDADEGLYVIVTGEVTLYLQDEGRQTRELARVGEGEFFGEMVLLRNEPSPISAMALNDVNLLIVDGGMIAQLLEREPHFATRMNFFIEKRQKTMDAIIGTKNRAQRQTARSDWVNIVKQM